MVRRRRLQNIITDSSNNEVEALLEERRTRDEESGYEEEEDTSLEVSPFLLSPCSLQDLNGSWYIQIQRKPPAPVSPWVRGPMRIEVLEDNLRISGDIYVKATVFPPVDHGQQGIPISMKEDALVIKDHWYPQLKPIEYRWYFRSTSDAYTAGGQLRFEFTRHLWNTITEEFTGTDAGWMKMKCKASPVVFPKRRKLTLKGEAMIGGVRYNVIAIKTSPYYRGCLVEGDIMINRNWPVTATSCDGTETFDFTGVYRAAGMDFQHFISDLSVPEDPVLTTVELETLLATHRSVPSKHIWRLWLFAGSRMDGTLGLMFDDTPPYREGAVGFYDPTLSSDPIISPSAQGKKLGEVPLAFLRTLIHEAGHAFNLFHPKHDVHGIPKGTTLMNQTGDVMGFATTSNPFPCNATFAFNNHEHTSLVHSPDPQVAPGRKQFGWGHGTLFAGVPEPVDETGLHSNIPLAEELQLEIKLPHEIFRGEFIVAEVTVTNVGDTIQAVPTALNLSEGYLRIAMVDPLGKANDVRDITVICSIPQFKQLNPGESVSGQIQLFYTNDWYTFEQIGRYTIQGELDVGETLDKVIRSPAVDIFVRLPTSDRDRTLAGITIDIGVGRSFALGDFGADTKTEEKLRQAMNQFGDTVTGAACAMVLANSYARDFRNIRANRIERRKDEQKANRALEIALSHLDALNAGRLAIAIVAPRETAAPLPKKVQSMLEKTGKKKYKKEDLEKAHNILSENR